jgi:hypothetical protein
MSTTKIRPPRDCCSFQLNIKSEYSKTTHGVSFKISTKASDDHIHVASFIPKKVALGPAAGVVSVNILNKLNKKSQTIFIFVMHYQMGTVTPSS